MAGRLISPPVGIGVVSIEPLSGPRTVGAGQSQSIGGFVQTVAAPFGLWRFQFSFRPMRDSDFRRYRGWITSLHGGANATRWDFYDPDMLKRKDVGIEPSSGDRWGNGQLWSNGRQWSATMPSVSLADNAERGASVISLANEFWGHQLQVGDYLGLFPLYFGLHMVTEELGDGRYRIWPPLRKAMTTDDFATLHPVLAMRLEGEEAATAGRGLQVAEGLTVTMVETLDYDVRSYFGG